MKASVSILPNNPFKFKLDEEPTSVKHSIYLAMRVIKGSFPNLIIETRALDIRLFGKCVLNELFYRQSVFVSLGGKWDERLMWRLHAYFQQVWVARKKDVFEFPHREFIQAFKYIEEKECVFQ